MRSLSQPKCSVCGEQVVIYSYKTVSAIESPLPTSKSVAVDQGTKQTFSFTNLAPVGSKATIAWKIDGAAQSSTATSLTVNTSSMGYGSSHSIVAEVTDNSAFVRNDPNGDLVSRHTWTLSINRPKLPDFYALYMPITKGTAAAGTNLSIESWTQNLGTVSSPSIRIDHFLSADTTFDASDVSLGFFTQNALAPTSAVKNVRAVVSIPAHVAPGKYFVGMVIDRVNTVKELDETNNVKWFPDRHRARVLCGPAVVR